MERLSLSKGKVKSIWSAVEVKGIEKETDVLKFVKNVDLDYGFGAWVTVSMSGRLEAEYAQFSLRRHVWNFTIFMLFILACSFSIIIAYEIRGDNLLFVDGVGIGLCMWILFFLLWLSWNRNINILRKGMKALIGAGVCNDIFVFCKKGEEDGTINLSDETVKARADKYGELLESVNEAYGDGWFNVWYIVPKTFESAPEYDERLRRIIWSVVSNTEERMRENDEIMFLETNKRQIGVAEKDFLID